MKYDELRKLAEAAIKEEAEQKERVRRYPRTVWVVTTERGAFTVAASPDVILALLDERERLREVVRRLLEPAPDGAFDSGLDPNAELAAFMDIRHAAYKEARALLASNSVSQSTPANPEGVES